MSQPFTNTRNPGQWITRGSWNVVAIEEGRLLIKF
jgi:hypothetical protein